MSVAQPSFKVRPLHKSNLTRTCVEIQGSIPFFMEWDGNVTLSLYRLMKTQDQIPPKEY